MTRTSDLLSRNFIVGSTSDGITVRVDGQDEVRPWSSVSSIGATIVRHGPGRIFVLAMEFEDARVFVIGEVEPAWSELVNVLHMGLPAVEPFSSWGPSLLEQPEALELYVRG